jgi:hypothetical protein
MVKSSRNSSDDIPLYTGTKAELPGSTSQRLVARDGLIAVTPEQDTGIWGDAGTSTELPTPMSHHTMAKVEAPSGMAYEGRGGVWGGEIGGSTFPHEMPAVEIRRYEM